MKKKQVVAGLGEIGTPIYKLLSSKFPTIGYDLNSSLIDKKNLKLYEKLPSELLHICIPFQKNFDRNILNLTKKFKPEGIVIHSTISPKTTTNLQNKMSIPIIYSATRGVHKRMLKDLKRYSKFFSIEKNAPRKKWIISRFNFIMKKCGVKTIQISSPITLELAKILCDTSYYGWLITYAQITNMIALKNNVNYEEMWKFSEEIHNLLGNRPKMFPGVIGGHCVIPNLSLIDHDLLNMIDVINRDYSKTLKKFSNS